MSAPRLSPQQRREVARFGIHEPEALPARVEAIVRVVQVVAAVLAGALFLTVVALGVLAVPK